MSASWLLVFYCTLIVAASLAGGWVPQLIRLTHQRMELAISGIAGFMLGVGLLHMLPHAAEAVGSIDDVMPWLLGGFLAMFFIERFFRYHHHEVPESDSPTPAEMQHACADHAGHHDHAHTHERHDHAAAPSPHKLSWSGAAVGLTLHSILDGVALAAGAAAAVKTDALGHGAAVAGLAVFMVILLHRPFDSMTLVTLMSVGGWSRRACHLANGLFALAIPLGVALFHLGLSSADHSGHLVGYALAFSAGTFLCISTSDLLPELQFHEHDRIPLSMVFLLGLALAWTVARIETHDHEAPAPIPHQQTLP